MNVVSRGKTNFFNSVINLISGAFLAQLIGFLFAPILARIYAPEVYGVVASFSSITGILGVIVCMRYELTIMLPQREDDAINLFRVSVGFSIVVSLLIFFIVWFGRFQIARILNIPVLGTFLWLVPVVVLLFGIFQVFNYWSLRTKYFSRISIAGAISAIITVSLTFGFGFGYATVGSMITSGIIGQFVAVLFLGILIYRTDLKIFLKPIQWQAIREGIIRYKRLPIYDSWASLVNVISTLSPPLLLATFFPSTVVGFYALGFKLLTMPTNMIGGAISQVFFQHASVAKNEGNLSNVVKETFIKLVALGLFPIFLVLLLGKDIFLIFFGEQWGEAGIYSQILAPWILFNFISAPISTVVTIMEKQRWFLFFNLLLLIIRIFSLSIGGFLNNIFISLALFSFSGVLMYFYLCLYILRKSEVSIGDLTYDLLRIIFIAIVVMSPILILKMYGVRSMFILSIGCVSLLVYYVILFLFDRTLRKLMLNYINKIYAVSPR